MSNYTNTNDNSNTKRGLHVGDPDVNSDATLGWSPGALWINTSSNKVWVCKSAAPAAATWIALS